VLVKVACPIVDGNELGYYVTYEDEMKEGEVLYVESETKPEVVKAPAKSK
jgi:hypothetical protein